MIVVIIHIFRGVFVINTSLCLADASHTWCTYSVLFIGGYEMNIMYHINQITRELRTVGVNKPQFYKRSLIHQINDHIMYKLNISYITQGIL